MQGSALVLGPHELLPQPQMTDEEEGGVVESMVPMPSRSADDDNSDREGTRTNVSSSFGCAAAVAHDDDNFDVDMEEEEEEEERQDSYSERPILVGYAFAAKKMNTMGIIMAEASRQVSFWAVDDDEEKNTKQLTPRATTTGDDLASSRLTAAALRLQEHLSNETMGISCNVGDGEDDDQKPKSRVLSQPHPQRNSFYSFAHWLRRRSSLSAASSSAVETTVSSTRRYNTSSPPRGTPVTTTAATTRRGSGSATSSHSLPRRQARERLCPPRTVAVSHGRQCRRRRLVRVSFVPLDLDMPLEEQHGGNFDVILHKLTEDILYVSQHDDSTEGSESHQRVKRLLSYRSPCCLVDDPLKVQMVMSRFAISQVLSRCLEKIHTLAVRAPSFRVLRRSESVPPKDSDVLKFPVMVKSLEAAGTAHSHDMAVVLRPEGLAPAMERLVGDCLVQDYVNHNSRLFKVYVLGDVVKVFLRPSLPNLPLTQTHQHDDGNTPAFVQFDSQKRPYPSLADFGIEEEEKTTTGTTRDITEDEIRPVAAAIRQAFGLDLFGFDVLVSPDNVLWVVDVNYFPSYKEVTNFPSLLAHYLTCRALQNRYASKD